jgi:hypothetical protein
MFLPNNCMNLKDLAVTAFAGHPPRLPGIAGYADRWGGNQRGDV